VVVLLSFFYLQKDQLSEISSLENFVHVTGLIFMLNVHLFFHPSTYLFQAAWPISEAQETQNTKTQNMKKTQKKVL